MAETREANCSVCVEMNKVMIFRGTVVHDGTHNALLKKNEETNARNA